MINKDFLREVLQDSKKLIPLESVRWVEVPKYDELSVKSIMAQFDSDDQLKRYLPSKLP